MIDWRNTERHLLCYATNFGCDFGGGLGLHERCAEIDRTDGGLIVTGHKRHHRFPKEFFYLPEIEIDLLAPAIDDDSYFLSRVTEAVEDLERSLRAANRGNVECQDENDFVRLIERGECDRVEGMLRIEHYVVVVITQFLEHFKNVLWFDLVCGVGLVWRGQQRQMRGVWSYETVDKRFVETLAFFEPYVRRLFTRNPYDPAIMQVGVVKGLPKTRA